MPMQSITCVSIQLAVRVLQIKLICITFSCLSAPALQVCGFRRRRPKKLSGRRRRNPQVRRAVTEQHGKIISVTETTGQ